MKNLALILASTLLLTSACGDDDGPTATDTGTSADATDAADTGGDATADAADGSGDAADAVVTALEIEAAFSDTASVGQNTLEITVTSDTGAPVAGATVTVDPQMPMMGHGSTEVPVVTDNGDGTYTAFPVTFQMGGAWVVTVTAELGDVSAEVELSVNVGS